MDYVINMSDIKKIIRTLVDLKFNPVRLSGQNTPYDLKITLEDILNIGICPIKEYRKDITKKYYIEFPLLEVKAYFNDSDDVVKLKLLYYVDDYVDICSQVENYSSQEKSTIIYQNGIITQLMEHQSFDDDDWILDGIQYKYDGNIRYVSLECFNYGSLQWSEKHLLQEWGGIEFKLIHHRSSYMGVKMDENCVLMER